MEKEYFLSEKYIDKIRNKQKTIHILQIVSLLSAFFYFIVIKNVPLKRVIFGSIIAIIFIIVHTLVDVKFLLPKQIRKLKENYYIKINDQNLILNKTEYKLSDIYYCTIEKNKYLRIVFKKLFRK